MGVINQLITGGHHPISCYWNVNGYNELVHGFFVTQRSHHWGGTCGKLAYRTKGDGHLGTFLEASVYTGQSSENNHHRMVKYIPKKSSKYMWSHCSWFFVSIMLHHC